jgi:hypothetical protein
MPGRRALANMEDAMKHTINYLYLPKGSTHPIEDEQVVDVEADESGFALTPDLGDHVRLLASDGSTRLSGRVKSRLFTYANSYCHIDVVLEETDESIEELAAP